MTARLSAVSAFAAAAVLALASCAQSVGVAPSASAQSTAESTGQPAFSQFEDMPIPNGATMNMDRSLVLGAQDSWIGRLSLETQNNAADMFSFYKTQTPQFGWQEITSVRASTSVLTYTRGDRVMTIQIQAKTIAGSVIDITVSPRGASGGAAPTMPAPRGS